MYAGGVELTARAELDWTIPTVQIAVLADSTSASVRAAVHCYATIGYTPAQILQQVLGAGDRGRCAENICGCRSSPCKPSTVHSTPPPDVRLAVRLDQFGQGEESVVVSSKPRRGFG
jgi:hypothetical protein